MYAIRHTVLFALLVLSLSAVAIGLVAAQESGPSAEAQALIDILESEEKRTALIDQSKAAAAPVIEAASDEAP